MFGRFCLGVDGTAMIVSINKAIYGFVYGIDLEGDILGCCGMWAVVWLLVGLGRFCLWVDGTATIISINLPLRVCLRSIDRIWFNFYTSIVDTVLNVKGW
jgi:hypothetical protein